jgi:choline dehydrogenase-like flavoprotein
MGGKKAMSVVNPEGHLNGVENLFIADGSVLPNAPGVNPMITIMAMAHRVSRGILSSLK